MPSAFIHRDPFARVELRRELLETRDKCLWCDNAGRFKYFIQTDAGKRIDERTPMSGIRKSGPFCCVTCFRAYNL